MKNHVTLGLLFITLALSLNVGCEKQKVFKGNARTETQPQVSLGSDVKMYIYCDGDTTFPTDAQISNFWNNVLASSLTYNDIELRIGVDENEVIHYFVVGKASDGRLVATKLTLTSEKRAGFGPGCLTCTCSGCGNHGENGCEPQYIDDGCYCTICPYPADCQKTATRTQSPCASMF
ncbi:hypothetical protein GC167_07465 [bacterium]|nr:hypothetical protein [bacterium]